MSWCAGLGFCFSIPRVCTAQKGGKNLLSLGSFRNHDSHPQKFVESAGWGNIVFRPIINFQEFPFTCFSHFYYFYFLIFIYLLFCQTFVFSAWLKETFCKLPECSLSAPCPLHVFPVLPPPAGMDGTIKYLPLRSPSQSAIRRHIHFKSFSPY